MENLINQIKKSIGTLDNKDLKIKLEKLICEFDTYDKKDIVINAGLLKAGKSSLFNAILGKKVFNVDVVRATIDSESYNAGEFLLIDTPGLDANNKDSSIAYDSYKYADVIIYSHNIEDGELSRIEIEEIKKMGNIFGGVEKLFGGCIFVLTHIDQKDEGQIEKIQNQIMIQLSEQFSATPYKIICVDSKGYLEGIEKEDQLLVEVANVDNVSKFIKTLIAEQKSQNGSLFRKYMKTELSIINDDIQQLVSKKEDRLNEINSQIECKNYEKLIEKINGNFSNLKKELDIDKVSIDKVRTDLIHVYIPSCYEDYKSRYDAERAGKNEINSVINQAANEVKEFANNYTNAYLRAIEGDAFTKVKRKIEEEMLKIREEIFEVDSNYRSQDINIELPETKKVESKVQVLELICERNRYIDSNLFRSTSQYCSAYDSNFYIDSNSRTEYTSGLFGNMKEKSVTYYQWDIKGACDDVLRDAKDILKERVEEAYDIHRGLLKDYLSYCDTCLNQNKQSIVQGLNEMLEVQINKNKKFELEKETLIQDINTLKKLLKLNV